jgi:hypothetical protein
MTTYQNQFHPEGPAEADPPEEMVAAKCRHRRLCAIETDLLDDEILQQTEKRTKTASATTPSLH